jgi:hypothetical protein
MRPGVHKRRRRRRRRKNRSHFRVLGAIRVT